MPSTTEKQREFMGAELSRKRAGEKTETGMSEQQLKEFASKPVQNAAGDVLPDPKQAMHSPSMSIRPTIDPSFVNNPNLHAASAGIRNWRTGMAIGDIQKAGDTHMSSLGSPLHSGWHDFKGGPVHNAAGAGEEEQPPPGHEQWLAMLEQAMQRDPRMAAMVKSLMEQQGAGQEGAEPVQNSAGGFAREVAGRAVSSGLGGLAGAGLGSMVAGPIGAGVGGIGGTLLGGSYPLFGTNDSHESPPVHAMQNSHAPFSYADDGEEQPKAKKKEKAPEEPEPEMMPDEQRAQEALALMQQNGVPPDPNIAMMLAQLAEELSGGDSPEEAAEEGHEPTPQGEATEQHEPTPAPPVQNASFGKDVARGGLMGAGLGSLVVGPAGAPIGGLGGAAIGAVKHLGDSFSDEPSQPQATQAYQDISIYEDDEEKLGAHHKVQRSMDDRRDELRGLIQDAFGEDHHGDGPQPASPWVQDVFDDFVIFEKDGKCFKIGYGEKDGQCYLTSHSPKEVKKRTIYEPVEGGFETKSSEPEHKFEKKEEQEEKKEYSADPYGRFAPFRYEGEFDETKHPRDHGKFSSAPGAEGEHKPESGEAPEPAPAPAPKEEPKPEAKAEPKAEGMTESKPESKTAPKEGKAAKPNESEQTLAAHLADTGATGVTAGANIGKALSGTARKSLQMIASHPKLMIVLGAMLAGAAAAKYRRIPTGTQVPQDTPLGRYTKSNTFIAPPAGAREQANGFAWAKKKS